jgi:hypothetical protein
MNRKYLPPFYVDNSLVRPANHIICCSTDGSMTMMFDPGIDQDYEIEHQINMPMCIERCKYCGVRFYPGEKFCVGCGAPV